MELADLIAAVKAAATKDALEALVKAELAIDLDKRKTLKSMRAEVLKGLGETADESGDGDEDQAVAGSAGDAAGAPSEPPAVTHAPVVLVVDGSAQASAPAHSQDPAPAPVTPPELEDGPEPETKPAAGNRLLRNKTTGRTFVWTPALAKLADLEEA